MKEKIIEIVGFNMEPERAELIAQQVLDLFAVSGSAFNGIHKCLKCEFEGNIANSMEDWETGEYFQYWSQKDIIECPHCGNMQHYRITPVCYA